MKLEPREAREMLHRIKNEWTVQDAWTLIKIIKHCRLRCRNNAALNNFMNNIFPDMRFEQVTKFRPDGSSYPGLRITSKHNPNATLEGEDDAES